MKETPGADKELGQPRGERYRWEAVSSPKVCLSIYLCICMCCMDVKPH